MNEKITRFDDRTMAGAPESSRVGAGAQPVFDDVTMKDASGGRGSGGLRTSLLLGRYRIIKELGRGGMGVVYHCQDELAKIEVAVKTLPPELSHNSSEMEDILDNFQLVSKLVHQNIAVSKNLEQEPQTGTYYLVMEYVNGTDLKHWMKEKRRANGKITLDEALPILKQVAEALDFAHEKKVIHRDIKPGNIMVTADGEVKVLDFGLAAQFHSSLSHISMAYTGTSGTAPYMAPEQWEGQPQGAAADQYALAVTAYEMLAGHLPFDAPDSSVLHEAVLHSAPRRPETIPDYAWIALARGLAKKSSERFTTCRNLVKALSGEQVSDDGGRQEDRRQAPPSSQTNPLLKRARIFLGDSDWQSAETYANRVLDMEPENAQAYLVLFLAHHHLTSESQIHAFDGNPNDDRDFAHALQYSKGPVREQLQNEIKEKHITAQRAILQTIEQKLALLSGKNEDGCIEIDGKECPVKQLTGSQKVELLRKLKKQCEELTVDEQRKKTVSQLLNEISIIYENWNRQMELAYSLYNKATEEKEYQETLELLTQLSADGCPEANEARRVCQKQYDIIRYHRFQSEYGSAKTESELQSIARQLEDMIDIDGADIDGAEELAKQYREMAAKLHRKRKKKIAFHVCLVLVLVKGCYGIYQDFAQEHAREQAEVIFQDMVKIQAGSFQMGSPASEEGWGSDETRHRVTLTEDYWLGKYEVTQEQYEAVMGTNPSYFKNGGTYPVECVSWNDAMEFCHKLNDLMKGELPSGYEFSLPTEAQWEYACRAGTTTPFSFGMQLNGREANCDGNYPCGTSQKGPYLEKTSPVGSYSGNAWGLYDMSGNVWEWCRDWYGDYPSGNQIDPVGATSGSYRVRRGGGWCDFARYCRSARRHCDDPGARLCSLGFRLALVPVQ